MSEEASTLMQLCTENVYNDNVFHLLGLPTLATLRQVRRRSEDLEAAHEMGEEAWVREFRHLRGLRAVPSFEEVQVAFERLKDPEFRLVSEFFRVWGAGDAGEHINPQDGGARAILMELEAGENAASSGNRGEIVHDAAVLRHKYAVESELMLIHAGEYAPSDGAFRADIVQDWNVSFSRWKKVLEDDLFWKDFESKVSEMGDPRLSGCLVRRMRGELPIAICSINMCLASKYAVLGRREDVQRHMRYIQQMSREIGRGVEDDVFSHFFESVERDLCRLVTRSDRQVAESPRLGGRLARQLLRCGAKCLVEEMLPEGHRIRKRLTDTWVKACNAYLMQYGNETWEWEESLEVLESLAKMPCSPEQSETTSRNIVAVKGHLGFAGNCWFCQKERAHDTMSVEIKMYGNVRVLIEDEQSGKYRVVFNTRTVTIPQCKRCGAEVQRLRASMSLKWDAYQKAMKARKFWRRLLHVDDAETIRLKREHEQLKRLVDEAEDARGRKLREHPSYQEAVRDGYKEGSEPSQEECHRLYRAELASPYEKVYGEGFVMLRPKRRR